MSTSILKSLDEIISRDADPETRRRAIELRERLSRRPMAEILALVPGDTVIAKARACGVSRQTIYTWMNGARPYPRQALQVAKVTGLTVAEIRGSSLASPTAAARAASLASL